MLNPTHSLLVFTTIVLMMLGKLFTPLRKGPGKSWRNVLENCAFFVGSNGKQAAMVYHLVCVYCCLLKYCIQQFKIFLLVSLA